MRKVVAVALMLCLIPIAGMAAHETIPWEGEVTVPTWDYSSPVWEPPVHPWEFESFSKIREPVQTAKLCWFGWCFYMVRQGKRNVGSITIGRTSNFHNFMTKPSPKR